MSRNLLPVLLWSAFVAWLLRGLYFVGSYNDDSTYIALARELAQGHGYVDASSAAKMLHVRWPPGFPLLLSPLQWLWPQRLEYLRIENFCLSQASLVCWWLYLRRAGVAHAGIVTLLTGSSFLWALLATHVISEIPFVLLSILICIACEGRDWGQTGPRGWLLITCLCLACCSVRSVGITLAATVVLLAWRGGGRKGLIFFASMCAILFAPYLWMQYASNYGGEPESQGLRWAVAQGNFLYHSWALPCGLWMDPSRASTVAWASWPLALLVVASWGLVLDGWWLCWRRKLRFCCVYFVLGTGLLLFFPLLPLPSTRYEVTVLFLLAFFAWESVDRRLGRWSYLVAVLWLGGNLWSVEATRGSLQPLPGPQTLALLARQPVDSVCATDGWVWLYAGKAVIIQSDDFTRKHTEDFIAELEDEHCRLWLVLENSPLPGWLRERPYLARPLPRQPSDGALLFALSQPHQPFRHAYGAYKNGDRWSNLADFARAEQSYREALRWEPWMANARISLAIALWRQDKREDARAELGRASQLDPELERLQVVRGLLKR